MQCASQLHAHVHEKLYINCNSSRVDAENGVDVPQPRCGSARPARSASPRPKWLVGYMCFTRFSLDHRCRKTALASERLFLPLQTHMGARRGARGGTCPPGI